jgi:hypothetical protein
MRASVQPHAMIPIGDHWSRMFIQLRWLRNTSDQSESVTNRIRKARTIP